MAFVFVFVLCFLVNATISRALPAIPSPPSVITITTHSVLLEFKTANESVSSYVVEIAQEGTASSLEYKAGARVIPVDEDLTHRVTQGSLIPGGYYHLRIVPYSNTTRGTPSQAIRVRIRKPVGADVTTAASSQHTTTASNWKSTARKVYIFLNVIMTWLVFIVLAPFAIYTWCKNSKGLLYRITLTLACLVILAWIAFGMYVVVTDPNGGPCVISLVLALVVMFGFFVFGMSLLDFNGTYSRLDLYGRDWL